MATGKEGDRKICQECQIEIHLEVRKYQGEEKLSWRNPDGSAHFSFEDGVYLHTPTKSTPDDIWKQEIEERLRKIESRMGIVWGE